MAFVRKQFGEYYRRNSLLGKSLSKIQNREFGFASFEGWMLRHKSFRTEEELTFFLNDSVPRDAYFSCAYYEEPEAEMDKKGWSGADLIFDIDADHIPTICDKVHDEWTCGKCCFTGKGIVPESCPVCGSEKFVDSTWPCEVCLNSAKSETVKLLDILMKDFGFSRNEIHLFFSGHRGYHVHIEGEVVRSLDAVARKEIVDYVCGLGLDLALHELDDEGLGSPSQKDFGWRGRVIKKMCDLVRNAELEDYKNIGIKSNIADVIMKNKAKILANWEKSRAWTVKGMGLETLKKIAEFAAKSQMASVDTVVTTDIHRLIRLGGTLHGKTGLKKTEFPISALDNFDPFNDAVAFEGGTVSVNVFDAPKFRLADQTFGPYRNQKVELPTVAAVLLVCKKRAEVVESDVQ